MIYKNAFIFTEEQGFIYGAFGVENGKFTGKFRATGVRPKALEKIRGNGVTVNYEWFTN